MRIVASLREYPDLNILQVEKSPEEGEVSIGNGRIYIPIPEGSPFVLQEYLGEIDPANPDFTTLQEFLASRFLAQYPMYQNILWNFLLHPDDLSDIDLAYSGTFPGDAVSVRAQVGRSSSPAGHSPNTTGILPQNDATTPVRPGCIVTTTVDLSSAPINLPTGARDFMLWWKLYDLQTTPDVLHTENTPAIRHVLEVDQEPPELEAYISNDDGTTWHQVGRLQPFDIGTENTDLRVAFVNTGDEPIYLSAYSVLF